MTRLLKVNRNEEAFEQIRRQVSDENMVVVGSYDDGKSMTAVVISSGEELARFERKYRLGQYLSRSFHGVCHAVIEKYSAAEPPHATPASGATS